MTYKWSIEDCKTILYLRDYLKIGFTPISRILTREFRYNITKDAAIGKYRRLKKNGFTYKTLPVERV